MVIGRQAAFCHQRVCDTYADDENKNAGYTITPQIPGDLGFPSFDSLCKMLLSDESRSDVIEVGTDGIECITTPLKQLILGGLPVIIQQMFAPNQSAKNNVKNNENQDCGCQGQITDGRKRAIACTQADNHNATDEGYQGYDYPDGYAPKGKRYKVEHVGVLVVRGWRCLTNPILQKTKRGTLLLLIPNIEVIARPYQQE